MFFFHTIFEALVAAWNERYQFFEGQSGHLLQRNSMNTHYTFHFCFKYFLAKLDDESIGVRDIRLLFILINFFLCFSLVLHTLHCTIESYEIVLMKSVISFQQIFSFAYARTNSCIGALFRRRSKCPVRPRRRISQPSSTSTNARLPEHRTLTEK